MMERTLISAGHRHTGKGLEEVAAISAGKFISPNDDLPDIEQRVADLWDVRKDEDKHYDEKAYNTRLTKLFIKKDPVFAAMIDEFETANEQSFKIARIQQMHSLKTMYTPKETWPSPALSTCSKKGLTRQSQN